MSAPSLDTYKVSLTPALWCRIAPPGAKGDPSQPSVQEMTVKLWINSPNAEGGPKSGLLKAGMRQIHGVALAA